jgi:hypothetical protein
VPNRNDELTLVVPVGHALASRKSVRFKEVLVHEFVGAHLESAAHKLLPRYRVLEGACTAIRQGIAVPNSTELLTFHEQRC